MSAWFYILRLRSNGLYCGATSDREQRYKDHFSGRGARTTIVDPPIAVVFEQEFMDYKQAYQREQQVKRWSRAKKEALIKGDLNELKRLSRSRKK